VGIVQLGLSFVQPRPVIVADIIEGAALNRSAAARAPRSAIAPCELREMLHSKTERTCAAA